MIHRLVQALGRVVRAPGLLLTVILAQFALAALVGRIVRAMADANLGSFIWPDGQNLLYGIFELFVENPDILAGWRVAMGISTLAAYVFWTLIAGAVITRLHQKQPLSRVAAAGVQWLPAMAVVTLWHMIPRLVLLAFCGVASRQLMDHGPTGWIAAALTLGVLFFCVCALDIARTEIALGRARPFAPRTALRGFGIALKRPGVLCASMLFSLVQWLTVVAILLLAVWGLGTDPSPWLARGLSALGTFCALARIAVAVGHRE